MLVLDMSPSMLGGTPLSGLAEMKEAVRELITSYNSYDREVKVQLVGFATKATTKTTGWVTVEEALNILNNITLGEESIAEVGGSTNYDVALAVAMDEFKNDSVGKLLNGDNQMYFLTDGSANRGDGNPNDL